MISIMNVLVYILPGVQNDFLFFKSSLLLNWFLNDCHYVQNEIELQYHFSLDFFDNY